MWKIHHQGDESETVRLDVNKMFGSEANDTVQTYYPAACCKHPSQFTDQLHGATLTRKMGFSV